MDRLSQSELPLVRDIPSHLPMQSECVQLSRNHQQHRCKCRLQHLQRVDVRDQLRRKLQLGVRAHKQRHRADVPDKRRLRCTKCDVVHAHRLHSVQPNTPLCERTHRHHLRRCDRRNMCAHVPYRLHRCAYTGLYWVEQPRDVDCHRDDVHGQLYCTDSSIDRSACWGGACHGDRCGDVRSGEVHCRHPNVFGDCVRCRVHCCGGELGHMQCCGCVVCGRGTDMHRGHVHRLHSPDWSVDWNVSCESSASVEPVVHACLLNRVLRCEWNNHTVVFNSRADPQHHPLL